MVSLSPQMKLSCQFEAFKADTVVWDNGKIVHGEKLWTKGKNSCTILARSRMQMLWAIFCFGEGYVSDMSGKPELSKKRATPFQYMQFGDGTECLDEWYDDLVHPLIEAGQTYGGTKLHDCQGDQGTCFYGDYDPGVCYREPWLKGSWRLSDFQDVVGYDATGDSTTGLIRWYQWYHFGTEHACDATVREWGLFGLSRHYGPTVGAGYCNIRRYLNRNHLTESEQFYKGSNMIIRAMVTIEIGF